MTDQEVDISSTPACEQTKGRNKHYSCNILLVVLYINHYHSQRNPQQIVTRMF